MADSEIFLTDKEIAFLTGIKIGRAGKRRGERQAEALRKMGVPHYVNAVGRPVVVRAVLEGRAAPKAAPPPSWEPAVMTKMRGSAK